MWCKWIPVFIHLFYKLHFLSWVQTVNSEMHSVWCLLLGIQLQKVLWPKDWHACHLCKCSLFLCTVEEASVVASVKLWIKRNDHRVTLASKHVNWCLLTISFTKWKGPGMFESQIRYKIMNMLTAMSALSLWVKWPCGRSHTDNTWWWIHLNASTRYSSTERWRCALLDKFQMVKDLLCGSKYFLNSSSWFP